MEEILYHLGCKKKRVNKGINYQPQQEFWTINSRTPRLSRWKDWTHVFFWGGGSGWLFVKAWWLFHSSYWMISWWKGLDKGLVAWSKSGIKARGNLKKTNLILVCWWYPVTSHHKSFRIFFDKELPCLENTSCWWIIIYIHISRCTMGLEYLPAFTGHLSQIKVNIPVPWSIWAFNGLYMYIIVYI